LGEVESGLHPGVDQMGRGEGEEGTQTGQKAGIQLPESVKCQKAVNESEATISDFMSCLLLRMFHASKF
jgi:hypothetical protein